MKPYIRIVALVLHVIYFILGILSLGDYEYSGEGVGVAFAFWVYAVIVAIPCVGVHLIDVIYSFAHSRSLYNTLRLVFVVLAVPLFVFLGGAADTLCSIIWNAYFVFVFLIQTYSLFVKDIMDY